MISRIILIFSILIFSFASKGTFATGTILASFLINFVFIFSEKRKFNLLPVYILVTILTLSILLSKYLGYIVDIQESFLYLLAISFLFINGLLIGDYIIEASPKSLINIHKFSWIIISIPFIGKFIPFLNTCKTCNVPFFIFREPSHFILYVSIFLFFNLLTRYKYWKIQFILYFFVMTILYKSLISLIVFLLMILYKSSINFSRLNFILIATTILLSFGLAISSDLLFQQFQEKITFSYSNLSVLTYISGFQNIFYSFKNFFPSGVGLGNMGLIHFPLEINNAFALLGRERALNIFDGSFVFSKIITEMGIFGLMISFVILKICYKSHINFIKSVKTKNYESFIKSSIALAFSFSIVIQSLIRGGGVISIYTILLGIVFVMNKHLTKNLSKEI